MSICSAQKKAKRCKEPVAVHMIQTLHSYEVNLLLCISWSQTKVI